MPCKNQTVVSTDNEELECPCSYKAKCVLYENAISYLNLPAYSNVEEIVNALLLSLMDARERISALEAEINL